MRTDGWRSGGTAGRTDRRTSEATENYPLPQLYRVGGNKIVDILKKKLMRAMIDTNEMK